MKTVRSFFIFLGSFITFIISLKLFWNMGIFVDEFGANPKKVYGGDFWLYMDWLRLAILALITIFSGIEFFRKFYLTCKLKFSGYLVRLMKKWADMA